MASIQAVAEVLGKRKPDQVCILVDDLEAGIDAYSDLLGVGEWDVYDYSPESFKETTYRGQVRPVTMRIALGGSMPQYELIQPLSSPSIYWDWIEDHGYTTHHFGYFVASLDDVISDFEKLGYEPVQTGRGHGVAGDGGFAYFEVGQLVLEVIEPPAERRQAVKMIPNRS